LGGVFDQSASLHRSRGRPPPVRGRRRGVGEAPSPRPSAKIEHRSARGRASHAPKAISLQIPPAKSLT
jgi:hypothetical protein